MNSDIPAVEIDETLASTLYTQDYSPKPVIEGVKIVSLKNYTGEEGDFSEILRVNNEGYIQDFPEFKIAQINRTKLHAGSIKAWHLHMKQDEIWVLIPNGHLFVGLWDVRKNSPTKGTSMRIALGENNSQLLFIPRGVAHGSANFTSDSIQLFYLVNQRFNISDPDEKRLKWDSLGADFWLPQKD